MSIFKKGDRVFHPETGWVIVDKESKTEFGFTSYPYLVGTRGSGCYPEDELSFTEYTVEKNGFSQERPVPKMTNEEIKAECEEMYAQISSAEKRLKELRSECKHEKTFQGNYSYRVGNIQLSEICEYCLKSIKTID